MADSHTVLRIRLFHGDQNDAIFKDIPPVLRINEENLLIGRGSNCQLKLRDSGISRCHTSLEPYLEKGHTSLQFSLKNLSRKSKVTVNGLHLRYLQQVPLAASNKIMFCGTQMKIKVQPGLSLEEYQCNIDISESPLFQVSKAEETDEQDVAYGPISGSKTIQER